MSRELEKILVEHTDYIRHEIQNKVKELAFYPKRIVKENWPRDTGKDLLKITPLADGSAVGETIGVTSHIFGMKQAAIQSPDICLLDLKTQNELEKTLKDVEMILASGLEWLWDQAIQNELIKLTKTRSISLYRPYQAESYRYPQKLNFFGRRVYPFIGGRGKGSLAYVNPKYKKAAEQVVIFNKDTVHFLFPDSKKWVGELAYRNIPDREANPDGSFGYFRILTRYAAKPHRPDLGSIVTVMPPSLRGWLWYWVWKLIKYVP